MSIELEQAAKVMDEAFEAARQNATQDTLDRLMNAVRRHDAERVRAYRDSMPLDGNARTVMTLAASSIEPKERS
ncbi:hypothetical protein [Streptomyces decoyicus]|uniref:hypothetical protein n=1 Tax=Streptomyces decoyicus TaxID=249567 RepID=UPI0033AB0529